MAKPLSLFLSYSHKDEAFVNEFKKHLVTLRRKNLVEEWHDRELVTGDILDEEIKEKLLSADLVAFLVSVDFLASWYCYEVELKETLNRLNYGEVRIIPIIVRSCKWTDTGLSRYLAATKDGKPITKYEDQDDAWVEVTSSIERAAEKYLEKRENHSSKQVSQIEQGAELNPTLTERIEDTEVIFRHKHKEYLTLDDIFVSPDLKDIKKEYDDIGNTISAMSLADEPSPPKKLLILGGEQNGKTTLAKMLFKRYWEKGYLPLLCAGNKINNVDVAKLIKKLVPAQYANLSNEEYVARKERTIFIIDDYDKVKVNTRFQSRFLAGLALAVERVILISDTSIKYDESRYIELSEFSQYEILLFGNSKRGELIEKWNSIGREQTIGIKELHDENDRMTTHVDAIVRKNVLPRKPIYVLTVIQLLDTAKPTDYSLTSYGHCYQSLIQTALEKAKIAPRDFDLYINYLTELAYFIFCAGKDSIDEPLLGEFKDTYSSQYLVQSHDRVMNNLLTAGIMREDNELIGFGYRYIFYFYVAKYLADHIDVESCKKVIERLCENLHTERNANILIFLVHHTKDRSIIEEILLHASVVFDGTTEATLDVSDTKYLLDYIASIPKLVIEQRDIDEERRKRLKTKDEFESVDSKSSDETSDEIDDRGILSEINRSARLVEIIGQILRNRYGSLTRGQLLELSLSAYSSGLRFLNFFLTTTREDQEYILKFIQDIFRENTDLSDEQITKEARNIFLMFCYGASYSVIKKIAHSLGSENLMPVFAEINTDHNNTPAARLIYIAIKLEFTKSIPKKELSEMYADLEGNPIAQRLLQELVIQHLYLNHVDYQDRQWISSKLQLPMKSQRLFQGKAEYKL